MPKLFWCAPLVVTALILTSQLRLESTVDFDRTAPQPIGITAALLHEARFVEARPASTDNLPLPHDGKGPLVAVGNARDAERIGARWFVPTHTMARTTPLSFRASHREISPRTVWHRRSEFQIIDVREAEEFTSSHVPNSSRQSMFAEFARDKKIAIFCLTGHRSAAIVAQLQKRGYKNLYSVRGGWLDWQHQKLPMETR
ncbi:MAG TPA: rhodanese-like domain-containing protein [Abditibacteriaceae bacterium]|jgi:rhodanese-related sulfurtransferase